MDIILRNISIKELKELKSKHVVFGNSKQSKVREMLDNFLQTGGDCVEVMNWEEISDTLNNARVMIRNQISYRNQDLYKDISIKTIQNDTGCHLYLYRLSKGENNAKYKMARRK